MEFLAQIIAEGLGWIAQIFGELLLQGLSQALAELIGHAVVEPFWRGRSVRPWLAAIGYLIFGAVAGGLSVLLLPVLFIQSPSLRIANLLLTPLAVGVISELVGSWRERRGKDRLGLEHFVYGFCFAFGMAVVRYGFGH